MGHVELLIRLSFEDDKMGCYVWNRRAASPGDRHRAETVCVFSRNTMSSATVDFVRVFSATKMMGNTISANNRKRQTPKRIPLTVMSNVRLRASWFYRWAHSHTITRAHLTAQYTHLRREENNVQPIADLLPSFTYGWSSHLIKAVTKLAKEDALKKKTK